MDNYDDLVNIDNELTKKPDISSLVATRTPKVQRLIDEFIVYYENNFGKHLEVKDSSAEILTEIYFRVCYDRIKPAIDDKTNRYKMASLMELLIVKQQPFYFDELNDFEKRKLNSKFAFTAALSLINSMLTQPNIEVYFMTVNAGVDEMVNKVFKDHLMWLSTKDTNEMSIFITAQFHELVEILYRAPYQIHG